MLVTEKASLLVKVNSFIVLAFFLATTSYAADSDRISQLEKEVQDIKQRLVKLESLNGGSNTQQKVIVSSDGWKHLANWRTLKVGMSYDEVRALLGEPSRVNGGIVARWLYASQGEVTFVENRVSSWREPQ